MPEQPDFYFQLNEQRKIESITKIERNDAHRLVEECMLAANRSAAIWLADAPALFVCHAGLREDRYDNVRTVISKEIPSAADCDIATLAGYKALIKACESSESPLPLRSIFARMLQPGDISIQSQAALWAWPRALHHLYVAATQIQRPASAALHSRQTE